MGQLAGLQKEPWHVPNGHCAFGLQMEQVLPSCPQACGVSPIWQTSCSSQQPLGHVSLLQVDPWHTAATQLSNGAHAVHVWPPLPQSVRVSPAWQLPFWSQQPLGHVEGPHFEQLPPSQLMMGSQTPPLPLGAGVQMVWGPQFLQLLPLAPHAGTAIPGSQLPC